MNDNNFNNKELKKIASNLKPQFNLGKQGITNTFIRTIDEYLKAHEIVKIKALIAEDKNSVKYLAEEVSKETNSIIVETRGFTFVLFRKN